MDATALMTKTVVSFILSKLDKASLDMHHNFAYTEAADMTDLVSNACFLKGLAS